jgi:hypothetical protein
MRACNLESVCASASVGVCEYVFVSLCVRAYMCACMKKKTFFFKI